MDPIYEDWASFGKHIAINKCHRQSGLVIVSSPPKEEGPAVIFTEYNFKNLRFGFVQYPQEMLAKQHRQTQQVIATERQGVLAD